MKNVNTNTLVIFGASDHESALSKVIAINAGCHVATATFDNNPVHAGNAYRADGFSSDSELNDDYQNVIIFECNKNLSEQFPNATVRVCDHHNPGDYGYDKGPAQFWAASSIGQLCKFLEISPNQEMFYTAAADHCPADAYAGCCPGIDPKTFEEFRVKQIAAFEQRNEIEIISEIIAARSLLSASEKIDGLYNMTAHGLVKQLPEAALSMSAAYIASITPPPQKSEKIVLGGHTTPDQVKDFMLRYEQQGYETYGNPTRGFAGAVK